MKNKIFPVVTVSVALLFGSSCTKDFQTINTDPNAIPANAIHFSSLFTNAELITSGNSDGNAYEDWRGNLIYASCMIQHLSSTAGYWDGDKYFDNASYLSAYWDQDFGPQVSSTNPLLNGNASPILNIEEVVANTAKDSSNVNLYNMARIFRVFQFQRLTDMYGDIPYSQAGQGYISGINAPVYDKQQAIYNNMLSELQDAASKLTASGATPGAADLIYAGNVTQWQRFAYSEMVRIAMRLSKVDPTTAQKWVQIAVTGGVFQSNADNAIIIHQAAAANGAGSQVANGTGSVLSIIDQNSSRLSETFVNYLKTTNDPRLSYLGTVCTSTPAGPGNSADMGDTSAAVQLGQPNGYDNLGGMTDISNAPNWPGTAGVDSAKWQAEYSVVNRYTFARTNAPTFFLTYGETELLLAEAAQRGWITGSASSYYTNGVQGAMVQLALQAGAGPDAASISAYLTANPLTAGSELKLINTQYWVASFMDETESWANWRRSGFPVLTPVSYVGNATGATIPRRYTYPTGEAGTNSANYESAVSGLTNGDKMTSRVWWDAP